MIVLQLASLALRMPLSRRDALSGAGVLASAAAGAGLSAANAFELPSIDPIGAYGALAGKSGDVGGGAVAVNPSKPNQGILMLRETFDGAMPAGGLLDWYNAHLTDDFKASFNGGNVVLNKEQYLGVTADILKSFPDFTYTRVGPIQYDNSPIVATWTAVVKGTHTGAPRAP